MNATTRHAAGITTQVYMGWFIQRYEGFWYVWMPIPRAHRGNLEVRFATLDAAQSFVRAEIA